MSTSQTPFLSKPSGDEKISAVDFAYIKARGRQQAFNLVHSELKKNGISQATLARRTGKGTDVISRLLKRPTNMEQDTLSELIFAITGGGISYGVEYPMVAVQRSQVPVVTKKEQTTTDATISAPPQIWRPAPEAAVPAEAA
jgi:hypothetical protein